MGNNLNNKNVTLMAWLTGIASYTPLYPTIGRSMSGDAGTVKVGSHAIGGIASTLADNATSVTATPIASHQAEFTTAERYVMHRFPKHQLNTEKGLLEAITQLGAVAAKNIDRDFFGMVEGLLTAADPRAGTDVGCVGAGKKFFDTGKKGLIGESGEFLYDNKLTSGLSESALWSAVSAIQARRDDRGLQMRLGQMASLVVVCSSKNAPIAHELIKSVQSGADLADNYMRGIFKGCVCWEFSDVNDWMVLDTDVTPLGYYLATGREPTFEVRESEDGFFSILVAKYHGTPVYSPYDYGIVGADVE